MSTVPVVLRDVRKCFRRGVPWRRSEREVLRGVTQTFERGCAYALQGVNGAGKSTLLRLVAGLLVPSNGVVEVFGRRPHRDHDVRAQIGFASGDERSLFQRLSGRDNLEFFASQHDVSGHDAASRIEFLADRFDLRDFLDERVDHCSAGMKARLGLARALLHEPKILLLDEPTKSLDAEHARGVRELLRHEVARGLLLIAASHSDDEAAQLGAVRLRLTHGALVESAQSEAAE